MRVRTREGDVPEWEEREEGNREGRSRDVEEIAREVHVNTNIITTNNNKNRIENRQEINDPSGSSTTSTRVQNTDSNYISNERGIILPRWSWEDKPRGRILKRGCGSGSGSGSGVCRLQEQGKGEGEICARCLLERRMLESSSGGGAEWNGSGNPGEEEEEESKSRMMTSRGRRSSTV
ncbi:hypothetical protein ACMFMG_001049 [Clarireedia jacksonii]